MLLRSLLAIPTVRGGWNAHKIDSQLRGNWAAELVARQKSTGLRVLLVPAWPALLRVCVDGVVLVNGVEVADGPAGADPRSPVRSSRPAEHLTAAGASAVASLHSVDELDAWLNVASPAAPFAVCDALTDDDVEAIALRWAVVASEVLLAGPGGPIGAGARAIASGVGVQTAAPDLGNRWLILCGSLHPMARRQIAEFARHFPDVPVIASDPVDDGSSVEHVDAHAMAVSLAERARLVSGEPVTTVVAIGGDTAAALIGDTPWTVWGAAGPGLPYGRAADGTGPWIITKAGGFGHPTTLVDLYSTFSQFGVTA